MKCHLKTLILLFSLSFFTNISLYANSPDYALFEDGPGRTAVASPDFIAGIVTDKAHEWEGVLWAAENLSEDFGRVTGRKAPLTPVASGPSIIVGTIGRGGKIDSYLSAEELASLDGAVEKYLLKIAENLDISPTMREKAERSYRAVGEWLGDCDVNSDVKIMPQGSFYLGTVIRPVSDADEYDIDLVCLLKNAGYKSEAEIKKIVGDRLREHKTYSSMLEPEGKRCWTLCYDEFHMDISPCVPNQKYYIEPYLTEIKLTHKLESGRYIPKYSNPYKYHEWFEERMRVRLDEVKKDFSVRNQVEISKVPLYKVKTPLQRAIQLLLILLIILLEKKLYFYLAD